ncbi:hypothetical protein BDY19DRAFT_1049513 [Irpex rosettiformis]|uniref:Uncharacterized protein n=1 Tax=Irpex rosettiformis TaxID=378272 RepID=A0ACB8TYX0_9APHY|nr:hypothetical protein BDY19DRAFT_1049513 [Irpex rosettiformis]
MPANRSLKTTSVRANPAYDVTVPVTAYHIPPLTFTAHPLLSHSPSTPLRSFSPTSSTSELGSDSVAPCEEHIKRPPNAFILYRMEFSKKQKDSTTAGAVRERVVSQNAAAAWQALGTEGKKPYYEWANIAKAEHKRKYPNYKFMPKRKAVSTKAQNKKVPISHKTATTNNIDQLVSPLQASDIVAPSLDFVHPGFPTFSPIHDNAIYSTFAPTAASLASADWRTAWESGAFPPQLPTHTTLEALPPMPSISSNLFMSYQATMEQLPMNVTTSEQVASYEGFDLLDTADFGYSQYIQDLFSVAFEPSSFHPFTF